MELTILKIKTNALLLFFDVVNIKYKLNNTSRSYYFIPLCYMGPFSIVIFVFIYKARIM